MRKLCVFLAVMLMAVRGWCPPPSHPSFPLAFFPLTGNQNYCIPASIDGMVAWYVADDLSASLAVGASVTSWPDRSLNGNTLTNLVGAASRPTLSITNTQFNGHYTVTYDGGDNLVRTSPAGFSGESGQTIVAVLQHEAGTGGSFAQVCITSNALNEIRTDAVANHIQSIFGGGSVTCISSARFSTNGWYIFRFDNTSNIEQGFEDPGIPMPQTDQIEAGNFSSSIIRLGSRIDGSLAYLGMMAEIIIYKRSISDAELNTLYCYLYGRYKI